MTDAPEAKRMSAEELAALALASMEAERARKDLESDFPVGAEARSKWREARKMLADAAPRLLAEIAALEASPALFSDYGKGYVEERCALEVAAERERCAKIAEELEQALLAARSVFQEYVRLHRAKSPPDEEKAMRNFEYFEAIGMALARAAAIRRSGE